MIPATVPDPSRRDPTRFDHVVEALGIGVFETTLDGAVIRCNEACARLFGYADAESLRVGVADSAAAVYVDAGRRLVQIARLLVEGRLDGYIAQMRRRDGSTFWASETIRLVDDPKSGERRLLGSITDVSEVVDQREALAAAERDFRSIFENATVGVYRTSVDGRQLRANPALWRLNGYSSEAGMLAEADDLGRQWYVDPGRRAEFRRLIARDDRVVNFESEVRRYKTREPIWVRENAWAVRDADGTLLFYEGIVEEITLERQAEELRRAKEAAGEEVQRLLLRSADRLRVFADIAADWHWESDADGKMTFMSDGIRRLGLAPQDFVGRTREELPWTIDKQSSGFRAIGDHVRRRESYKDVTYPARLADGTAIVISTSAQPQFDPNGAHVGYRGIGRDVTEQVAARDALARSESRFRDAIESMASGFMIWDADDRLIAHNRRVVELMPHLADCLTIGEGFDVLRNRALRLAHPGATEMEREARRRRRDAQRAAESSFDMTLPDGRIIEVFDRRTSEGGFITVYRDVTKLRGTLQRLAESEARFRDFAETTADWFWEQDSALRFTYVSPSNEAISGIPAAAHVGLRRTDTRKLGVSDEAWQSHLAALDRREAFKDFRYERIDPTGRRLALSISGKPVFDGAGRFLGYRGSGKNLTELVETERALEEALEKANAATAQQRRFAETLAHEFRTPLTIIDGASQRLTRHAEMLDPEGLRVRVAKIRTAVRSMGTLIDTMLNSARLASGRLDAHMTAIDLVAFTAAQIRRFDPAVTGRDIELASDAPVVSIFADEKLLEQIVANLLSNAIKYSGDSRRINVSIAGLDDGAVLRVRDYGIGIPADEVPKLFTRFFRASTAKNLPGTGIGLNLVHELVAMHGGTIAATSELGRGTTFTVTLPGRSGDSRSIGPSTA